MPVRSVAMTRPSFVLTDRDVGLPRWSAREIQRRAARLPVPATIFTLAKLAQWRAAEPRRALRAELEGFPSIFFTHPTFEKVRAVLARREHAVVHRYAAILALIRVLVACGRPSRALDPSEAEVEQVGDLLLTINRLLGGAAECRLRVTPQVARRMWLGEHAAMMRELHGAPPIFGWQVGASVFRRVATTESFRAVDAMFRRRRWPSLAAVFSGLAIWLGHSSGGALKPHLYRLPELDRENRAAAWAARRLACRRKDGAAMLRGWDASPAASRLWDHPFFVHRGTAVCVDPLALGDVASLRFGAFVRRVGGDLAQNRRELRLLDQWTTTWNKQGFEALVRDELLEVADAGDQPRDDGQQQCDVVVRFGRAVLFVEVKLTQPSPSTLRLRDRVRIHRDLLTRFGGAYGDGLPQVLATMKTAAMTPSYLPHTSPCADDWWWAIVVTAEPVPCTREWRAEWRKAAERLPRPGIQPFHGPLFFTVHDLCWFIELVRNGREAHETLASFMESPASSFSNFAAETTQRGLPSWLDARAAEHFAWLGEQVRR